MLQTSLQLMKSLNKPRLPFFICNVFLVSKGNFLDFYSAGPGLTGVGYFEHSVYVGLVYTVLVTTQNMGQIH